MPDQTPFSLRIFVADGDPDGLRLVERSNWIGKAIVFPRAIFTKVRSRSEFVQTGVYLLLGPRASGEGESMYIGEGDPVRFRLEDHYAKKDFWTRAVFFVAGANQLNKAHVQYLEAQLVSLAKAAKRVTLENANTPTEPTLSEADRADMDVFLGNILQMLPVLGISAFERSSNAFGKLDTISLYCRGRGIEANGFDSPQGFVIRAGSFALQDEAPSFKQYHPTISDLRTELQHNGILAPDNGAFRFTQDYIFSSPSAASDVVLGRSSNGRTEWKDANGRTLKEIQQAQAELAE